jgi:hypothetical protein
VRSHLPAWECCLRGFWRLATLEREPGLPSRWLQASSTSCLITPPPGCLRAFRAAAAYAEVVARRSRRRQIDLIAERRQPVRVSTAPTGGLAAADHAVVLRELTYALAARRGSRVTFAPVVPEMAVGNGVHAHISLLDGSQPVMHDPQGPASLSETAGRSSPGILHAGAGGVHLATPSPIAVSCRIAGAPPTTIWRCTRGRHAHQRDPRDGDIAAQPMSVPASDRRPAVSARRGAHGGSCGVSATLPRRIRPGDLTGERRS